MREWLGESFDLSFDGSKAIPAVAPKGQRRRASRGGQHNQDDEGNRLDWSLDPRKSDWAIEIICKEEKTSTLYNVHKVILAVGPWKCNYFERLLENGSPKGKGNNTRIRIKLHKLAADVFPQMLDYCYGAPTASLAITTETAAGLHSLGTCFDNKWLKWEAREFWENDLSVDNCHIYYVHARVLQDELILKSITELLCVNIKSLSAEEFPIVAIASPEFWLQVFEMRQKAEQFADKIPASLITDVCECHKDELLIVNRGGGDENRDDRDDSEEHRIFDQLTCEEFLPFIEPDTARRLLEIHPIVDSLTSLHVRCLTRVPGDFVADVCERLCPDMTPDAFEIVTCDEFLPEIDCDLACRLLRIEPKFIVSPSEDKLTPLQLRCLSSFCENWSKLERHDEIIDFLQTQNPLFLREICKGTASQLAELYRKLESTQSVLNKTLIRERESRQDYEAEIERLNEMLCNSIIARKGSYG